jgi:hypothetical protein
VRVTKSHSDLQVLGQLYLGHGHGCDVFLAADEAHGLVDVGLNADALGWDAEATSVRDVERKKNLEIQDLALERR